jgi:hypothetical protein
MAMKLLNTLYKTLFILITFSVSLTNGLAYSGQYRMTSLGHSRLSPNVVTHILVAGTSMNKDSDQFFQSTLLRAYKYRELYPDHQVILISSPEVRGAKDAEVFEKFNLPVLKKVKSTFTMTKLVNEMKFFKKIASFDFYGHSSPWALKLGKKNAALEPKAQAWKLKELVPNFTKNAYATLNGCNGGFKIAPNLSQVWKIPVSGTLTSTKFEKLQLDGLWYKKSDRTSGQKAQENTVSYDEPMDCSKGVCWRLKSSRRNYSSHWGSFDGGGLSFPKFFCHFDNSDSRCEKAMALNIISFPSVISIKENSPRAEYQKVVFDYLCSTAKNPNYFLKCKNGILNAINIGTEKFQIHPGNALHCNFKKCNASIKCKHRRVFGSGPRAGTCKVITKRNTNPTTLVREYKALMKGYSLIQ